MDGIVVPSESFCYFCSVIPWMVGKEMLAVVCGLAILLGKTFTTFASDTLKLRNFQIDIQRRMAVDVYYNVYIYAAQVRPFHYREGVACVSTYMLRWRRRVLLLLSLMLRVS